MDIIPDKVEFKRADVEKLTSLSGKVLDYWEKKYSAFYPQNKNGEKFYLHKDVLIILKLKQYLTIDRLNDDEIKNKLSGDIEIAERSIEKKKITNKESVKKVQETKEKKASKPVNPLTIIEKRKKRNILVKPKENNKKNKNNLNIIKQDLQEILTILKNNDKNGY